jgi:serine/threonine-protein kinase
MQCGGSVAGEVPDRALPTDQAPDRLREQLVQATLGEYEVLTELGRGGMAAVYLADDLALGRRVAIKVMIPGLEATDGMSDRFLLEARTAAQLSHPNIIPIYAVRTAGRLRYFVMKCIPGRSLDRVLAEYGPLPAPVVQAILAQVGSALEHAHGRGVVHRDVKPANIMLDEDGTAIVADFGIAKVARGVGLTQAGSTVGTPTYMSPEQCTGRGVTGASDQYALGCVAFELVAGRPPFVHQEVLPVLLAHVSDTPPPLLQFRADCPLELAAAIDKMLAKDPEARWATMAEAIAAAEAGPYAADPAVRELLRRLSGAEAGGPLPPLPSIPVSPVPLPRTVIGAPRLKAAGEEVRLAILPGEGALAVGQVVRLSAVLRGPSEPDRPALGAAWSSTDPAVLRVTEDGELTAVRPGEARIRATEGDLTTDVGFQVTRVDATQVSITPVIAQLGVGEAVRLEGVAADRLGARLSRRVIAWTSSDTRVANVEPDGTLQALAVGTARIGASAGGGRGWMDVRVVPGRVAALKLEPASLVLRVGESAAVEAIVQGQRSTPLAGIPVEWQSSDCSIVAVSAEGIVRGLRFGSARIAATAGGRRATIAVEVRAPSGISGARSPLNGP